MYSSESDNATGNNGPGSASPEPPLTGATVDYNPLASVESPMHQQFSIGRDDTYHGHAPQSSFKSGKAKGRLHSPTQ